MDLVGAGFTNHGGNAGGILIDTESGGHVEFVNADPAHTTMASVPSRFFSVEEVYNTNRNPAELGIVHPLMYENEDSLIGQLGYSTGALHNSDRHSMTWCRNFDGGRSFTTTLGHNWQYAMETWFRDMMLNAVQWTAGQEYANCVTFNEVRDLLTQAVADGDVNAAGNSALSAPLEAADAAYRADDFAAAAAAAAQFVAQTKRVANCGCADGGAALLELQSKGVELVNWMGGDEDEPPAPRFTTDVPSTVGGNVPATLSHDARDPGDVRRVHAGRGARLQRVHHRERHLDRGRRDVVGRGPERHQHGQARQRHVHARAAAAGQRRRCVRARRRLREPDRAEDVVRADLQ